MSAVSDCVKPLTADVVLTPIAFKDVEVGEEFWWGGYLPHRCNWGRKRSSRTGDWRPVFNGELQTYVSWSYWRANETVYIVR
jgi:hypothetical protein